MDKLDDFTRGYLECLLWTGTDESTESGGEPLNANYNLADIDDDTIRKAEEDCAGFREVAAADLAFMYGIYPGDSAEAYAGHNFALTRNGNGTGFWDRGMGDVGDRLTAACKPFGEWDLYVGDDGKLYGM